MWLNKKKTTQHGAEQKIHLDKKFEDCVKNLTETLFSPENLIRKEIGGEPVSVPAFLIHLEQYVKAFSGKELPDPKTVLQVSILFKKNS